MKPTSPRTRPRRLAMILAGTVLGAALTACSTGHGPTQEPQTVACSGPSTPQDHSATRYLGLTQSQARALAASQKKQIDIVGQDGHCERATDLDIATNRVQLYLQHGNVTWSRYG